MFCSLKIYLALILTIEAMMVHLMSMNLKHFTNFDGIELSVRGRKRIPKHLSKPDVGNFSIFCLTIYN